jgi:polysaccharide biosynthesis protein PslH
VNLLYVTPRFPYPPVHGDRLIVYHRLRTLGRRHSITLASFYEDEAELRELRHVAQFCRDVVTVRVPRWRYRATMATHAVVSRTPLTVLHYRSRTFRRAVRRLLAGAEFDVVHGFTVRIADHLVEAPYPRVLELMDSMRPTLESIIPRERPPMRWVYNDELRRILRYEPAVARRFDGVVVVSPSDARELPSDVDVTVVVNGVDVQEFSPAPSPPDVPRIVFSGNMGYVPNVQAVRWFCDRCLPAIRTAEPAAVFSIVGSSPTRTVRALESLGGVEVTGFVESVADELRRARVAVAPILSGSGVQNKVLEAMACALPVVTTRRGLEPLEARPGEEVLVAESAPEFAREVIELLRSPERASAIGDRARAFVVAKHSWESSAEQIEEVYGRVVERGRKR